MTKKSVDKGESVDPQDLRVAGLALVKSIEDQLKDQAKRGYPVSEGLKGAKALRRYLKKAAK